MSDDAQLTIPPTPRRWPIGVAGVAVGVVAVLAVQAWLGRGNSGPDVSVEETALSTVEVSVADLIEDVEWSGELAYDELSIVQGSGGTVTRTAEPGTVIEQGSTVIEIDGVPRVAFFGTVPSFRSLSEGTEGSDVFQLETNLAALGFDPDGTVTIDEDFTYYTELMVQRWQESLGIEATGVVNAADIHVMEGPAIIVDSPVVGNSATGPLVTLAPQSDLGVTVPVAVGDADEWAVGNDVIVVLADETEVAGTVDSVGSEVTTDQNGSTVEIEISLVGNSNDLLEGPVTVRTAGDSVLDATVVPTRALVSLAEGGFAVEKSAADGSVQLIGIEIGAFDEGLVEVTAGDVAPGDRVVVPQ